jgi:hypothetical protein
MLGGQDNKLRIWDVKTARLLRTLGPFTNPVKSVAYGDTWRVACENPPGAGAVDAYARIGTRAGNANARTDSGDDTSKDAGFAYQPGIWVATEDNLEFFSLGLYK